MMLSLRHLSFVLLSDVYLDTQCILNHSPDPGSLNAEGMNSEEVMS